MRAVITIVGKDAVGILAKTANVCAAHNANIPGVCRGLPENQSEIFNPPDTMIPVEAAINASPMMNDAMVSYLPCP